MNPFESKRQQSKRLFKPRLKFDPLFIDHHGIKTDRIKLDEYDTPIHSGY